MNDDELVAALRDDPLSHDAKVQELEAQLKRLNVLEVAGLGRQETKHSRVLAWLLRPDEAHGLGTSLIDFLIGQASEAGKVPAGVSTADLQGQADDAVVVCESLSNIDLFIWSAKARLVITIENKVDAGLSDTQLNKYFQYVERVYPDCTHLYFFLTPAGYKVPLDKSAEPETWTPISYGDIVGVLEGTVSPDEPRSRASDLVLDYVDHLKRNGIVQDEQLDRLVMEVYSKHQDVFDLVQERMGTWEKPLELLLRVFDEVVDQCQDDGKVSRTIRSDRRWHGFSTADLDAAMPADPGSTGPYGDGSRGYYWLDFTRLDDAFLFLEVAAFDSGQAGGPRTDDVLHAAKRTTGILEDWGSSGSQSGKRRVFRVDVSLPLNFAHAQFASEVDEDVVRRSLEDALEELLEKERVLLAAVGDERNSLTNGE